MDKRRWNEREKESWLRGTQTRIKDSHTLSGYWQHTAKDNSNSVNEYTQTQCFPKLNGSDSPSSWIVNETIEIHQMRKQIYELHAQARAQRPLQADARQRRRLWHIRITRIPWQVIVCRSQMKWMTFPSGILWHSWRFAINCEPM